MIKLVQCNYISAVLLFPPSVGVPDKPQILGVTQPVLEGDQVTLTCVTSGSKPAAEIRWLRNGKEVTGEDRPMR